MITGGEIALSKIFTENSSEGLIFNIQRFSVHDGPGIRTTVFMKGCPLRCSWCANPESQSFTPELMVRDVNCKGCGACADTCPKGAITVKPEQGRFIDRVRCGECFECVAACIYGCLQVCGEYFSLQGVLEEILKDKHFYRNSGGGVTVSGGEPLAQHEFTTALLKRCKEASLHTALDTCGYASWEVWEKVLPFVDQVLYDLKHLHPEEHRRKTGVDNELILRNLKRLSGRLPLWLRFPLVPGFNDSKEHIKEMIRVAAKHRVEKFSVLPYHEGGKAKSCQLGKKYTLELDSLEETWVELIKTWAGEAGLSVSIGN